MTRAPMIALLCAVAALAQESRPPDLRAEILAAEAQLAAKDPAGAAARLAAAIRTSKPEGELARAAHRSLARALVELGNFGQAAEAVLTSFGLDAGSAPALAIAARGFVDRGDRRAARALLGLAYRLDRKRADLLATAAALALEEGDAPSALRDAEILIALAPADVPARVLRARALHALGRTAEARDALAALDRAAPLEPALLRVLGALDLETGLLADAERAWERNDPIGGLGSEEAAALARAWLERGEPKEALRVLARAGMEVPEPPAAARLRAAVHLALGDGEAARAALATIRAPTTDDRVAMAHAERIAGRLADAAKILEALLASDAGVHAARAELVLVRMLQGDLAAARRLLRDGLLLAPHHGPFVQALDDLVPELARADPTAVEAVLSPSRLEVGGVEIDADPAAALARLRPLRLAAGPKPPTVRLVLAGSLDAARVARAFELLAAAGFGRVAVEAR